MLTLSVLSPFRGSPDLDNELIRQMGDIIILRLRKLSFSSGLLIITFNEGKESTVKTILKISHTITTSENNNVDLSNPKLWAKFECFSFVALFSGTKFDYHDRHACVLRVLFVVFLSYIYTLSHHLFVIHLSPPVAIHNVFAPFYILH